MGQLDLPVTQQDDTTTNNTTTSNTTPGSEDSITTAATTATDLLQSPIATSIPFSPLVTSTTTTSTDDNSNSILSQTLEPSLFKNILSANTGPSPEYLQSLLHVNETLLAQSLANTTAIVNSTPPMLTPIEEQKMLLSHDINNIDTSSDTQSTSIVHPEPELIISPLSITANKKLASNTSSTTHHHHIQS